MRVVVLGEHRADRLVPPLRQAGAEVVVLGFVDLNAYLGPGVTCGELPPDLTCHSLSSLLRDYKADVMIPNVNSPGQEQMLPTYARVAADWRATGRRALVHSEGFAELATDKVYFHQVAEQRGWPVPRGVVCDGPQALLAAVDEVGLPAMVKEARSESYAGRHFVWDHDSLRQVSPEVRYPVLAQQVLTGHEFAIELLTVSSHTIAWPVTSLGTLDSRCTPGKRVRVGPAGLPDLAQESLVTVVHDMVDAYQPAGPWQIDFAVSDGELRIIELNGRLGGVSNMSWMSTRLDPHVAHVSSMLGRPLEQPQSIRVALELPVHNGARLPPTPAGIELRPFVGSPTVRLPLTAGYYRAVLGVPGELAADARTWLLGLPPGVLLVGADEAVAQLVRGVRALALGGASLSRGA